MRLRYDAILLLICPIEDYFLFLNYRADGVRLSRYHPLQRRLQHRTQQARRPRFRQLLRPRPIAAQTIPPFPHGLLWRLLRPFQTVEGAQRRADGALHQAVGHRRRLLRQPLV